MTPGRRPLSFASLEEIPPDLDRLLIGHRTVGRWSLGQICNHLAGAIGVSIGGDPAPRLPRVLRAVLGPFARRALFRDGWIPERAPLPKGLGPASGLDDAAEADALRAALRRLTAHDGPFASHPLIGTLTREEWLRFHCVHCAHHLSFAIPTG